MHSRTRCTPATSPSPTPPCAFGTFCSFATHIQDLMKMSMPPLSLTHSTRSTSDCRVCPKVGGGDVWASLRSHVGTLWHLVRTRASASQDLRKTRLLHHADSHGGFHPHGELHCITSGRKPLRGSYAHCLHLDLSHLHGDST
jgi:hypothetical protein